MTKTFNLKVEMDQVDSLVEQYLIDDANRLWQYAKGGDAISYQYLEGLKTYMKYCGIEWTPEGDTDEMEVY